MDERELISAAQFGSLDAFNELVLMHQDAVYRQAYYLLKEPAAAQDLAQDAFILAYRNLETFRGGTFRSWLLRITTNACLDELRRWKRRDEISLYPISDDDEEVESPSWIADPSALPEEQAETSEVRQALQRLIFDLPAEQRAVLVLVDVEGYDYEEAARTLSIPVGTIKSRLARARQRIKEKLATTQEFAGLIEGFGLPQPCPVC